MGGEHPGAYKEGQAVAAQAAATSAEAVIMAALTAKQITKSDMETALKETIEKLETQAGAFGVDVKSKVHKTVLGTASKRLLGS